MAWTNPRHRDVFKRMSYTPASVFGRNHIHADCHLAIIFKDPKPTWRIRIPGNAADVFIGLLCLWFALLLVFHAFPQIDLYVSQHFFVPDSCRAAASPTQICGHFPYRQTTSLDLLRTLFLRLPYVIAFVMLWKIIACYQHHGSTFNIERARSLKIALGSLFLGPVLFVNIVLKDHWGRPRPFQTMDFGGTLDFMPAGSLAGKCVSNCSFISGEAAGAGWLLCLIVLVPQPARSALILPLAAISFLTPAMRLAFGAHFLSDVVLGWLSSLVIFSALLALTDSSHRQKILKFE
jgi:membrane-associated phospholipid phosphatase